MNTLKIAYFGTPDFAAQLLYHILEDLYIPAEIHLVVTQPDKPVGRKQIITPSPVKKLALEKHIPVFDKDTSYFEELTSKLSSLDLALLYAYGEIIPENMLQAPKHGFWNVHPSLLPLYRGASPIAYPLFMGDAETGVSLIQMVSKLDQGPVITQVSVPVPSSAKREDMEIVLTNRAYNLFKDSLITLTSGLIKKHEQHHSLATYTRKLKKQDGYISYETLKKALNNVTITYEELPQIIREYIEKNNLQKSAENLLDSSTQMVWHFFRAMHPWPGLWTTVPIHNEEKRLKITALHEDNETLHIETVQLEGKQEVDFKTFQVAYSLF